MSDCLIVGGGVIGLSLAYELAGRGLRVQVSTAGSRGVKPLGPAPAFAPGLL